MTGAGTLIAIYADMLNPARSAAKDFPTCVPSTRKTVNKQERDWAHQLLQNWGEWHRQAERHGKPRLGYGGNPVGRAVKDMPSTRCPTCIPGRPGKVRVVTEHGFELTTCPVCHGSNRVKAETTIRKVNPAFIPSTRQSNPYDAQPEIHQQIDQIKRSMPEQQQRVMVMEYVRFPRRSQRTKAYLMRVSMRTYERLLYEVRADVIAALNDSGLTLAEFRPKIT